MCGFATDSVAAKQGKNADTQLEAGVDQSGEGDNCERTYYVHFYFFVYLCPIYSISGLERSKNL